VTARSFALLTLLLDEQRADLHARCCGCDDIGGENCKHRNPAFARATWSSGDR
jgi:hypothetical protein